MTIAMQLGVVQSMVQNTVYALPNRRCLFFTDATSPTVKVGNDVAMSTAVTLTLTNGAAEVSAAFIELTSSGPINGIVKAL